MYGSLISARWAGRDNTNARNLELRGQHKDAHPLFNSAFEQIKQSYGNHDLCTLNAAQDVARNSLHQGKKRGAEKWYEEVLKARKSIQGPAATDTLKTVEEMASLFEQMGRIERQKSGDRRRLWQGAGQILIIDCFLKMSNCIFITYR